MAVHEIGTTAGLFRRAVEVYLRQNGETDFDQFRLQYDGSTQTIDVSLWNYQDLAQPTRAQLIGLLVQAKRRLARLTERETRREKNKRRADLPPAVYVQQGTTYTGTGSWGPVTMLENGGITPATINIETAGLYRISLSGICSAGAGWIRVTNSSNDVILRILHNVTVTGTLYIEAYSGFRDVNLPAGDFLRVYQQGVSTTTITHTVESIIPA